jgi:hypothetical protein
VKGGLETEIRIDGSLHSEFQSLEGKAAFTRVVVSSLEEQQAVVTNTGPSNTDLEIGAEISKAEAYRFGVLAGQA